jgi:lambda family phage tail tape measure protein
MDDLITLGVEVQTTGGAQAAQGLGSFEKAAQSAAGAADKLEDKVNALGAAQSKSAAPAKAMAGAVNGIGSAFKNNASSIQNASFQLSDVIVQVTGGVDATRALGMQLPQLLGGFGPLGAVLGVVAGALFSVVPLFFSAEEGATDLKTATDGLTDAMNAFGSATKAANQDFSDLRNTYGANSDAAQHFLEIQREIADLQARQAFGKASAAVAAAGQGSLAGYSAADLDRLSKQYAIYNVGLETASVEIAKLEGLSRDLTSTEQARLDQLYEQQGAYLDAKTAALDYTIGVAELEKKLGAAEGTGSDLAAAFAQLSEARTFEDQSRAAQHLSEMILAATDGLREATPEGMALHEVLLKSVIEALQLEQLSYGKGELDAAAVAASKLADEINRAASNAITLSAQSLTARTEAEIRLKFKGDTVGEARALAETRFPMPKGLPDAPAAAINRKRDEYIANMTAAAEAQKALADFNKEVKSGAKSTSTAAADIKRYYDATRTDGEKYADGLKQINELHASGAMDADLYARSVQQLAEQFDPLGQLISGLADTVENELNAAFASVLNGTASLGDALLNFASNVLAKVAQDLFAQQFSAPIAAGIKGLFSADGNVFDQRGYVPFAKGGVVSGPTIFPFANGTGLMGEAGPEAIMPLSRGSDGRLGIAAANGNSAPKITINNYSGQEASASTDAMGNIMVQIGRAIAQDITSGGPAYKAIKSTFGISNRLQQRG